MNSTDAGETITASTESEADSPNELSRATKHLEVNIRTDGVVNCDLEINLECKHCDSRKSFANLVEFLCHVIQAHDEKFLYRCNICCGNFRSSKVLGHFRDHVEENNITLSGITKQPEEKFKREVASGINECDLDSYPGEQAEDMIEHGTSANNVRKNLRRKTKQLLKYESLSHDTQDSVHAVASPGAEDEVKISRKIKLGKSSKFGTSKKFVCSICYGNFDTSSELGHHFQMHEECLTCLVCGQTFTLKSRLKKHMLSRHLNNQQSSGGVKRPKKTEKSATRHLCAVCGKVFSLRSRLTKHFRIHTGEKPYKCKHCGKSFSLGSNLQRHERIHTGERPFLCTTCGKSFNHLTSFKTHTLAHKGIRPPKSTKKFNCDFCNKDYSTRGSLRIHLRLHTNDCPFKCTECPKSFTKKIALTRHMMDHTGNRPYKCKYCEKAFKQLTSVDIHMRTHTGDKPFACNTCGKSFSNRANLHRHDDTHKGLRRYNCGFCHKDFTQRSTLKDHLNIHTGARPYQCSHCNGAFANQSTYSKHVSKHLNKSDV